MTAITLERPVPIAPTAAGGTTAGRTTTTVADRVDVKRILCWFIPTFAIDIAIGAVLAFHYGSFNGDAQARVANAYYVLFSRDPHLTAIGFVWNPLPSMSTMPLLLFSHLWPALHERAFAGNIASALFMAGAVVLVRSILADFRVRRTIAIVLTLLFAVQPMVVYYGANGMSEGIFLFTLLGATRHLCRYLERSDAGSLVKAGVWMGVAYYARNEAVAAAGFAGLVVLAVAFARAGGDVHRRIREAITDAMIFGLPAAFAFVSWAAASWLIVGHPFEQFSSEYGTSSQLQVMQSLGTKIGGNTGFAFEMAFLMAPMAAMAAVLAVIRAVRDRDPRVLGPLAALGGALVFAVIAFAKGQTAGWFRYFISGAPLTVLLAGLLLSPPLRPAAADPNRRRGRSVVLGLAALLLAVALAGPSVISAGAAMADPNVGREEQQHLGFIFHPKPADPAQAEERGRLPQSMAIARHLDHLDLGDRAVIVDTFTPCVPFIVMASHHPKQFVITNDRDFKPILADPVTFKARYLLVPSPSGFGQLDAINRAYPGLYDAGSDFATKVGEFRGPGCPDLRLFAVTPDS